MSGLTLGLMSLSLVDLEVLMKAGSPQRPQEFRLLSYKFLDYVHVFSKEIFLLPRFCPLLRTSIYSYVLSSSATPWQWRPCQFSSTRFFQLGELLISVTLILAFGEIIPQAVCSQYGLSVGAKLSVLFRLIVIVVFPISYPIGKLMDLLLGKKHYALLRPAELKTLVDMHGKEVGVCQTAKALLSSIPQMSCIPKTPDSDAERLREAIEELQRRQHSRPNAAGYCPDAIPVSHLPCHHASDESCVANAIGNLCRSFLLSYGVRVGIGILLRAFKLARRQSYSLLLDVKQLVSEKDMIVREEGLSNWFAFGGFTGSYHAHRCLLRKIREKETPINAFQ
ncbi:hypothetical protein QYF36_017854 [Acer negundo]|nr:hypothetical protein QYF36_017854 [Acer negundo]